MLKNKLQNKRSNRSLIQNDTLNANEMENSYLLLERK